MSARKAIVVIGCVALVIVTCSCSAPSTRARTPPVTRSDRSWSRWCRQGRPPFGVRRSCSATG